MVEQNSPGSMEGADEEAGLGGRNGTAIVDASNALRLGTPLKAVILIHPCHNSKKEVND